MNRPMPLNSDEPFVPKVSVCIPTFNGAMTICESVESVLSQTFTDFELIISDDGSSDETLDLVSRISDPRIKILRGPASGSAEENWNHLVSAARGRYVKLMGQDDVLYPNMLETEMSMFAQYVNTHAVVTFSKRDLISASGRRLPRVFSYGKKFQSVSDLNELLPRVVRSGRNLLGEPVCATIKREVLENVGGFAGSYLIDIATWIRLLEQGPGIFIDTPQCGFRISRTAWSYRLRQSQARQTQDFNRAIRMRFPELVSELDVMVGSVNARFAQIARGIVIRLLSSEPKVHN